jgi:hypothetical protein
MIEFLARWILAGAVLLFAVSCQLLGGAHIEEIALGYGKPSNVATFVAVTYQGKPVVGLPPSAFQIQENGQQVDQETAQPQLIDVARYASFYTVLLVDISQANQAAEKESLAKAVSAFVRRVRQAQPVSVLAYDGSDKVRTVGDFAVEPNDATADQVSAFLTMSPADRSRNLRGAILHGLDLLDRRLSQSTTAVRVGTLVVFARGPDMAGRCPIDKFNRAIASTQHKLVYVGISQEPQDESVQQFSQSGQVLAQSKDTLPIAFEEAGTLVDGLLDQYYLLSYCSPSRAGERTLRITVSVPLPEGLDETDSFETKFFARGFAAGCDPRQVPQLVLKANRVAAAAKGASATGTAGKPAGAPAAVRPETEQPSETDDHEAPVPAKPGYAR